MFYFLPENLDLPALLQAKQPTFRYSIDCFTYILGQITWMASTYKDLIDEHGYVPLHAPLLKLRVHNYIDYMKYLTRNKILECNDTYTPGVRSKGYRFADQYRTSPVIPFEITKRTLLKSINAKDNWSRNMEVKYGFLHRHFNDKLHIDYEGAVKMNELLILDDILSCRHNAHLRFNANHANIVRLKERDYYYHTDYTAGRIHTNLTALKKELRPYISYDGQILGSVDVVASQPFLIGNLLLEPDFLEKESNGLFNYYKVWGKIREALDLAGIKKHTMNLGEDAELFRQDCKLDFYTAFMERIRQMGIEMHIDRKTVKTATYMVLYSRNGFLRQNGAELKRIFKAIYPSVYALLESYKLRTHTALPVLLMHIEAQVILSGVARGISKRKKDMPVYTLHDSIVLPATEIELCKDVFAEEYSTLVGAIPPLKTTLWVPGQ